MLMRRVSRFVDDILRNRRPRRFTARPEELEAMAAAIRMLRLRPARAEPDPVFVDQLGQRLRAELEGPVGRPNLTRRRLLGSAGALAAAAAAGAVADHLVVGRGAPAQQELAPNGGSWVAVAAVAAVAEGQAVRFSTGSIEGFVVNVGGHHQAVSAVCTHLGCILQASGQGRLSCPCHRSSFSLAGEVVTHELPETPGPLPRLRTRVHEGQIEVFSV
jgi:cytochrome b6-f complex iron-sulfur subunit